MKKILVGSPDDHHYLALNLYHEARGEKSLWGRLAVCFVVLNRVADNRWPNTVQTVVYQKSQFSWTTDNLSDEPKEPESWAMCQEVAKFAIQLYTSMMNDLPQYEEDHLTKGSNHYHTLSVSPKWSRNIKPTITLGHHIFYKL